MMLGLTSTLAGWGYVALWSISLYPPVLINHRLKSVEGVSFDTCVLSFLGSIAYFGSVLMFMFWPMVRAEYQVRHGGRELPLVQLNDLAYAGHSVLLTSTLLFQISSTIYRRGRHQRLSRLFKVLMVLGLCGLATVALRAFQMSKSYRHYELVDLADILGSVKILSSSVKYAPQVYFNYRRRSVAGFSLATPALDMLGSVLCVCQMAADALLTGTLRSITRNPVKLALAVITFTFNLVFLVQHLIYRSISREAYRV